MPNDDTTPLPRLLIALAGLRSPAGIRAAYDRLALELARELPLHRLPLALLRLRRHLSGPVRPRAGVSARARAARRPAAAARGR